jgi:hypothetical protein
MDEIIGKKFMYLGMEYEVIYISKKKRRLNIQLVDPKLKSFPNLGKRIEIEGIPFLVTYIHKGLNRITIEPIVPDDFLKNNDKENIVNEPK